MNNDFMSQFDEFDIETRIHRELKNVVAREEAKKRYARRLCGEPGAPDPVLLESVWDLPDEEEIAMTIDQIWPRGGNILLSAAAKAGKSTTMANLIRSLCDGDPFLGEFEVNYPVQHGKRVVIIDLEMRESRVVSELRAQGMQNYHKVAFQALRGKEETFNLEDEEIFDRWINVIQELNTQVLIIDPLGPMLSMMGVEENSNDDVSNALILCNQLKERSGVEDLMIVHHSGHNASARPRGASRLQGWPDALWYISVSDPDDPDATRTLHAKGRDVAIGRGDLVLDSAKRLTYVSQSPGKPGPSALVQDAHLTGVLSSSSTDLSVAQMARLIGQVVGKDVTAAQVTSALAKRNSLSIFKVCEVDENGLATQKKGVKNSLHWGWRPSTDEHCTQCRTFLRRRGLDLESVDFIPAVHYDEGHDNGATS